MSSSLKAFMPALPAFALAACMDTATPPQADQIAVSCVDQAGAYDWFIGKPLTEVQAFFPAGDRKFATREPGRFYSQEYIEGRTLVYVDGEGMITRVRCG